MSWRRSRCSWPATFSSRSFYGLTGYSGKYYLIAVDATGVVSFDHPHCEHCLVMETKNTTKWYRYVLEAKLVTENGLCISPATGWIENPSGEYDKQDCERKAFARLSEKIKKHFPRLPLCILADGLYPYAGAFDICRQNDWKFIFVLQDKSLKSVQEELILPKRQKPDLQTQKADHNYWIDSDYHFVNDIVYQNKYALNWLQYTEKRTQRAGIKKKTGIEKEALTSNFEYVTNIRLNAAVLSVVATSGRLRWKALHRSRPPYGLTAVAEITCSPSQV